MTAKAINDVVCAYDSLVERALDIVGKHPYCHYIDEDNIFRLVVHGDELKIVWKEYESDYYGGGYQTDKEFTIDMDVMLMRDADLKKYQDDAQKEADERAAKVRAAQEVPEPWTKRAWTDRERDGMARAFEQASRRHGHYEALFAVGAWLLRHRAALAPQKEPGE